MKGARNYSIMTRDESCDLFSPKGCAKLPPNAWFYLISSLIKRQNKNQRIHHQHGALLTLLFLLNIQYTVEIGKTPRNTKKVQNRAQNKLNLSHWQIPRDYCL